MAVVEFGPIVQSIRGSLGGVTFRRVGARTIASTKSPGPVSPGRNSAQNREDLRTVTSLWRNLDPAVKEFWVRWHALDKPVNHITGHHFATPYHAFVQYQHCRMLSFREPLIDRPPALPVFSVDIIPFHRVFFNPATNFDGNFAYSPKVLSVFLTGPVVFCTMSRNPWRSRYPRLVFPGTASILTNTVINASKYIWDALGIPPGVSELATQTAPTGVYFRFRGWTMFQDTVFISGWGPPSQIGSTFKWPPNTPNA